MAAATQTFPLRTSGPAEPLRRTSSSRNARATMPASTAAPTTRPALLSGAAAGIPAILALADGTVFRGTRDRRARAIDRRGRVQHGDDRLPGNPDRSVVRRPDRHAHVSAHRQRRRQSRRTSNRRAAFAAGLVIRDLPRLASNFRATGDLRRLSAPSNGIVGIADIDTRKLTRILREKGAQNGCIVAAGDDASRRARCRDRGRARAVDGGPGSREGRICTAAVRMERRAPGRSASGYRACGARHTSTSSRTTTASSTTSCACWPSAAAGSPWCRRRRRRDDVLALSPDGVFLSNGPGDPEPCDYAIARHPRRSSTRHADVRHLPRPPAARDSRPARRTIKMKFGHHGANHPVQDQDTRPGADHEPEPRLRGRSGDAARQRARHARLAVRRHAAGLRAHRQAGVQLPGPSRGEPRPARHRVSVRPLREADGRAQDDPGTPKTARVEMRCRSAPTSSRS